ncbi:hypothetical protein AJ87_08980 [Rhizobium yanglingense]|nr:hypothetical protein AJ87_08980 [Rhizobium yanglingense]
MADVIAELGEAIYQDPASGAWLTADAYLSGAVRSKLAVAKAAAELDHAFARNVSALMRVQPADLRPSDITARLGAPWIPATDVVAFVKETMEAEITIHHMPELATWTVNARQLEWSAAGTTEWGTHRRHAGQLLSDALNSSVPQIFDTVRDGETERRVLNTVETEAAKEKLGKIKAAFQSWIWSDPDRTDHLARIYNDTFNNIAPRAFDGSHLQLPGASGAFSLYGHQKRGIWRIISAGATYLAHAVGAGKTLTMAAAIMEQRRLGLINKAMLVVPGHCLAQAAREFLALYPNARILVADDTNFVKEKRHRFLSRAATANWDAVIITLPPSAHLRAIGVRGTDDPGRAGALRGSAHQGRSRRPAVAQAHRAHEGRSQGAAGSARYPQGRPPDHLGDRHRPDHRRRGAGVPQALLRHQYVDAARC